MIIHHRKHVYPARHTVISSGLAAHEFLERSTCGTTDGGAGVEGCDADEADGDGEDEAG